MLNNKVEEVVVKTLSALGYRLLEHRFDGRSGTMQLFIERGKNYIAGKYFEINQDNDDELFSHFKSFRQSANYEKYSNAFAGRVSVEDCEFVSNHLSKLFAVDDVDYQRLEVSSAGLDRVLVGCEDYINFAGFPIIINLKNPIANQQNKPQKKFRGVYQFDEKKELISLTDNGCEYSFLVNDIEKIYLDEDEIFESVLNFGSAGKKQKSAGKIHNRQNNKAKKTVTNKE